MKYSQIIKSCKSSPAIIKRTDKDFSKKLDFKDTKFPGKMRDIHKIKKKGFHRN